ncbi:MAG: hypothetical protein ACTHK9_04260 [Nitrobacter sp.]|jgi:hypothetical protein
MGKVAMKMYFGVSLAAMIMTLSWTGSVDRAEAAIGSGMAATRSAAATDVSAARRSGRSHRHRHHRPRVYVHGRHYYERPTYYVPQGPAPFFPFGVGYGLDPSW